MEKQVSNKGFTLVECCVVLVGISILSLLIVPAHEFSKTDWYVFPIDYWLHQSQAIKESQKVNYSYEDETIHFNEIGNVSKAQTIHDDKCSIVIELGGGRLVERCSD